MGTSKKAMPNKQKENERERDANKAKILAKQNINAADKAPRPICSCDVDKGSCVSPVLAQAGTKPAHLESKGWMNNSATKHSKANLLQKALDEPQLVARRGECCSDLSRGPLLHLSCLGKTNQSQNNEQIKNGRAT